MKRKSLFLLLFLLLLMIPFVRAQEMIVYGDSTEGSIEDPENESAVYAFEGEAGDSIVIEVDSEDTDPVVYLLDEGENVLAQHDDISADNLNARLEYTLEGDGTYLVVVGTYAPGSFTVSLSSESAGGVAQAQTQTITGVINDDTPFEQYTLPLNEGDRVSITADATSGDLDTYLILLDPDGNLVAENDDANQTSLNSALAYTPEASGEYTLIISRYEFEDGQSSGDFELTVTIGGAVAGGGAGASFEDAPASPNEVADWTILAYIAGDNDLEESAIIDVNEFEIAGGSDENVRVVVLLDRSPEHDTSNGNWTTARVYEISTDSGDADVPGSYMPLLDTEELFDLGAINSGTGVSLQEFLVWGIENYPAQNYVISVNNHGGGWTGLASDDTEGGRLSITPPEFVEAFEAAREAAGVERFAMLINDACLMSSVEYLEMINPYFDYTLGAAEIMYGPGYDMTLLTQGLREGLSLEELSGLMIDRYMETMEESGLVIDQTPTLIDLHQFPAVSAALENFASLYNQSPAFYAQTLGEARYNTYAYGQDTWLRFLIDAGDLMAQIQYISDDPDLTAAAEEAWEAMQASIVYSRRGPNVPETATLYNINFPLGSDEYISDYANTTTLFNWNEMLSNYYNGFTPRARTAAPRQQPPQPTLPPSQETIPVSEAPEVAITNVYPQGAISVNQPAIVSMEVVGRNIARGTFTVDEVQADGTVRRVDTTDIVTFVEVEEGVFDYINDWDSGVNDFDFVWTPILTTVTDGTNTNIELVSTQEGQSFLNGRYRQSATADWVHVRLSFNEDGVAVRGVATGESGQGLAGSVQIREGGEFQAYNAEVTADGRVVLRPGNLYSVTDAGLVLGTTNAPSGGYRLGFVIEALGGVQGFGAADVTVDNDNINPDLLGFTSLTQGFTLQHPTDWDAMEFFAERDFFSAGNGIEQIYVYPIGDVTDLETTLQGFIDLYSASVDGDPVAITVAGNDALEFNFTTESEETVYTGRGFALFKPDTGVGLVFSAERTDGGDLAELYDLLLSNVVLFDAAAVEAADAGEWDWDLYTDETYYPVPRNWLPGEENDFGWVYSVPEVESAFAAVTVYEAGGEEPRTLLQELINTWLTDYTVERVETYYGENHTWEVAYYTTGTVTGRLYITVENDRAYALWFEAPSESADALFVDYFEPMLDGFEITAVEE